MSRVSPERGWSEGAEGLLRREFPTEWEDGREYGPGLVADTLRECEACLDYERISDMLSVVSPDRLTSAEAVREDIAVPAMVPLDEAERLAASSDLLQLFLAGEGRERKVGRVAVDLSLSSRSVLCPC